MNLKPTTARGNDSTVDRPIVVLGYQNPDGTITVTDVLCANFPPMTQKEMAALSWKLDQWSKHQRSAKR